MPRWRLCRRWVNKRAVQRSLYWKPARQWRHCCTPIWPGRHRQPACADPDRRRISVGWLVLVVVDGNAGGAIATGGLVLAAGLAAGGGTQLAGSAAAGWLAVRYFRCAELAASRRQLAKKWGLITFKEGTGLKAQQARVQQAEQALQARVTETSSQARQLAVLACQPQSWAGDCGGPGTGVCSGSRAPAAMGWKRWCLDNAAAAFRNYSQMCRCNWMRPVVPPRNSPCAIVRPAPDAGLQ